MRGLAKVMTTCGVLAAAVAGAAGGAAADAAANQPPTAYAIPAGMFNYDLVEGSGIQLDASRSSDPDGDGLTYNWDLDGDGEYNDARGATPALSADQLGALRPADGDYTDGPFNTMISVQVNDHHNAPVTAYAQIAVDDALPTGRIAGDTTVPEGSVATLAIDDGFDVGPLDRSMGLHYLFDTDGDGVPNGSGSGSTWADALQDPSVTYVPDDNGTLHLSAAILDKDGGTSTYTRDVTVTDVAPTATLTADGPVVEGTDGHVRFSDQSDPSQADTGAGFHYAYDTDGDGRWDVGDGTYDGGTDQATAVVPTTHSGTTTVRAAIIDKDDGRTTATADVVVTARPAPAVTVPAQVLDTPAARNDGGGGGGGGGGGAQPAPAVSLLGGAAAPAPKVTVLGASVPARCVRAATVAKRGVTLAYRLSGAAAIRVTLERAKRGASGCGTPRTAAKTYTSIASRETTGAAGAARITLAKGRRLRPGAYRLTVTVLDAGGHAQSTAQARLWVVKD